MVQVYDMKRLHMGCGESLQSQLSLVTYDKLHRLVRLEALPPDFAGASLSGKKQIRDKSH